MSDSSSDGEESPTALPCEAIVHRAALRKNCIDEDNGCITSAAFIRRPGVDVDGLSVDLASYRPSADFAASFNRCRAIVSLHTGRIRSLGLDAAPDRPPNANNPSHASITGVPFKEDDPEEAERLASALARQSRIVWRE